MMRPQARGSNRRAFLRNAAVVGGGAILAGRDRADAFTVPTVIRPQQSDTIKATMVAGFRAEQLQSELLPVFEEATGLKVVLDAMPYVALHEKMTISLVGGAADWDVLYVDEGYVPQLSAFMEPLAPFISRDEYDLEDFFPATLLAGQWDGEQISLPQDSNVQFFTYRTDLFEQLGVTAPPATWDEVMTIGQQVRQELGDDVAGYTIVGDREDLQISFNMIMFFWSFGTDVFDDQWRPIFNNDQGRQAVEYYRDLIDRTGLAGAKQFKYPDVLSVMQAGDSAMAHVWSSGVQEILAGAEPPVSDHLGTAVLPSNQDLRNPMRGTWTIGINTASAKKDQAWEFIKWLCGPEGGRLYSLSGGGTSCRRSVLSNEEYRAKYFFADNLAQSLEAARARPLIPETQQILDALNLMGSRVISGQADAPTALTEAEQTIQTVMERAGYYA